jgi:hypothetical protein
MIDERELLSDVVEKVGFIRDRGAIVLVTLGKIEMQQVPFLQLMAKSEAEEAEQGDRLVQALNDLIAPHKARELEVIREFEAEDRQANACRHQWSEPNYGRAGLYRKCALCERKRYFYEEGLI